MKLQQLLYKLGSGVVLASGSASVWAAEGASGLGDNLPVIGLAAALLIFAFTRKSEKSTPAAPSAPEAEAAPAPAEVEAVAESEEAPAEASEEVVAETASAEESSAPAESEAAPSEESAG